MTDLIIENIPLTKEWLAEIIEKKIGVKPKIGTVSWICNMLKNILEFTEWNFGQLGVRVHVNDS